MVPDLPPDYDQLDRLLAGIELAPSPAEAQAILCGLLVVHEPDPIASWYEHLLGQRPGSSQQAGAHTADECGAGSAVAALDLTFAGRMGGDQGSHHDHALEHACDHDHDHDHDHGSAKKPDATAVDGDRLLSELAALARWTETAIEPPAISFDLLLPPEERPLHERALAVHDWVRGLLFGLALGGLEREALSGEAAEAFDDLIELTRMDLAAIDEDEEHEQALAEITEFLRVAAMAIREAPPPRATAAEPPGPADRGPKTAGPDSEVQ